MWVLGITPGPLKEKMECLTAEPALQLWVVFEFQKTSPLIYFHNLFRVPHHLFITWLEFMFSQITIKLLYTGSTEEKKKAKVHSS